MENSGWIRTQISPAPPIPPISTKLLSLNDPPSLIKYILTYTALISRIVEQTGWRRSPWCLLVYKTPSATSISLHNYPTVVIELIFTNLAQQLPLNPFWTNHGNPAKNPIFGRSESATPQESAMLVKSVLARLPIRCHSASTRYRVLGPLNKQWAIQKFTWKFTCLKNM